MNFSQAVEQNWTKEAFTYSQSVKNDLDTELREIWTKVVLQNAPQKEVLDILDIGTGPGFFPIILSQAGHNVMGIDCVESMLNEARKNAENENVSPKFVLADGQNLPFDDNSFDCVISRNVAWTLQDAKKAYNEWLRVLKVGGKIIIFDANWNIRYHNKQKMDEYINDQKIYSKLFNKEPEQYSKEAETYRKSSPMCSRIRPQWDIDTLIDLGVTKIIYDGDIYKKVWDDERKVKYRSTPMFLLVAEKTLN